MTVIALEALTMPLHGRRLIEASAGTGKTYTIANLYLRLVAPIQDGVDFRRALTVDQILVVTFTEAATAELKARIRQRIRDGRQALLQGRSSDVFLSEWIKCFDAAQASAAVERLLYAEKQMDEAAIFTIHGFCQRMLSQNAFESRMLFQQAIETDDTVPLALAVKDVWRRHLYPMSAELAKRVRAIWPTPKALQAALRPLLNQPSVKLPPAEQDIESLLASFVPIVADLKQQWRQNAEDIIRLLDASDIKGTFWFNTAKSMGKRQQILTDMAVWTACSSLNYPEQLKRFDASELALQVKKNGRPPSHRFFEAVAALRANFPTEATIKLSLMARFWRETVLRMQQWQQQTQKMTFTDLLTTMDQVLQSHGSEALIHRIRQLYPLALIDEFQDTDPIQYRIFSSLYPETDVGECDAGLIMIGDPKQAIYAFRGADIYTYLQAKQHVAAVYALDTNYRSSSAMIQAVNRVFALPEEAFRERGIRFLAVKDRHIGGRFFRQGQPQAALQFLCSASNAPVTEKQYEETMALLTANHIQHMLLEARTVMTTGEWQAQLDRAPVQPKDMAILVSNYTQAQKIKRQLALRGIASVYLSDRGSVFASHEAMDLWFILRAIYENGQETAMRTALATPLLQLSHTDLDRFNHDDVYYEFWSESFRHYRTIWDNDGVLPMLRAFMQDMQLAANLLQRPNGERSLTNLLHLGEKLQQRASQTDSKEAVLRYLLLSIQNPNANSDEQKIRLESDADLVRIVTIHKSKGLEYPLVYLPFALKSSAKKSNYALYAEQETLIFSPCPSDDEMARHNAALFATEVRLAYVALTRAKEACFIGCAEIAKAATKTRDAQSLIHLSGVGSLLYAGEARHVGALEPRLRQLCAMEPILAMNTPILAVTIVEAEPSLPPLTDDRQPLELMSARPFNVGIERDWWVGSYSSLIVQESHYQTLWPSLEPQDAVAAQDHNKPSDHSDSQQVESLTRFTFPRGAKPGTFLHDVLEQKPLALVLETPCFADLLRQPYQGILTDYYHKQGYADWEPVLQTWLSDILTTPMLGAAMPCCLKQLVAQQYVTEMEFFLPVSRAIQSRELDRLARQYDPVSQQALAIAERPLKGMLKGFVDLLFEWEGKYYVVDYKSNYLGDAPTDYHPAALEAVIVQHRYDLQYHLYTLALHRLLKQRLPDYDYDQHIGGVLYLFLRGLDGQTQQGVYQTRLDKTHVMALDRLFDTAEVPVEENVCVD